MEHLYLTEKANSYATVYYNKKRDQLPYNFPRITRPTAKIHLKNTIKTMKVRIE